MLRSNRSLLVVRLDDVTLKTAAERHAGVRMKPKTLLVVLALLISSPAQESSIQNPPSQGDPKLAAILKRVSHTSPEGQKIIEKVQDAKPEINGLRSTKTLNEIIQAYIFDVGQYGIIPIGWEAAEKKRPLEHSLSRWRIVFHYQDYTKRLLEAEWEYDPNSERLYPYEIRNAPSFWTNEEPKKAKPSQRTDNELRNSPIDRPTTEKSIGIHLKEEIIAGLRVSVLSEYRSSFSTLFVTLVIPDEAYSRENLVNIWRHYCEKYTDKKDRLDVRIYANRSYEFNRPFHGQPVNMHTGETIGPDGVKVRLRDCEASFLRMGKGAAAFGGDNELMIYSPNLDEPEKKERIVLAGEDPFN